MKISPAPVWVAAYDSYDLFRPTPEYLGQSSTFLRAVVMATHTPTPPGGALGHGDVSAATDNWGVKVEVTPQNLHDVLINMSCCKGVKVVAGHASS